MRRDSIFYKLFQQFPGLLFDLLDDQPENAQGYRFDSVSIKEPRFEIDGVFLPPDSETPGTVYFTEVQFQKDEQLYERVFGESFVYFIAIDIAFRIGKLPLFIPRGVWSNRTLIPIAHCSIVTRFIGSI